MVIFQESQLLMTIFFHASHVLGMAGSHLQHRGITGKQGQESTMSFANSVDPGTVRRMGELVKIKG